MSSVLQATKAAISVKAQQLIAFLPKTITANILDSDFRPYMGKLAVSSGGQPCGKAVIYWSPKKNSFSLSLSELRDLALHAALMSAFDGKAHNVREALSSERPIDAREPVVYVDGSAAGPSVGYGLAVYVDGQEIYTESDVVPSSFAGMNQVGGEIYAAIRAVEWAKRGGHPSIRIAHDYTGVEKWATGKWKRNLPATQGYHQFMIETAVKLAFVKIDAHTGVAGNERADGLAKAGSTKV